MRIIGYSIPVALKQKGNGGVSVAVGRKRKRTTKARREP